MSPRAAKCACWVTLALVGVVAACGSRIDATAPGAREDQALCDCQVRSWVVAGRGRHLLAEITCPPGYEGLNGVVEFTATALREDGAAFAGAPLVARMTPGVRLSPAFGGARQERVEAAYRISVSQALCLTGDRVYSARYALLGPNSNSGLRAALESCGLALPPEVLAAGGPMDEFPGVGLDPGEELSQDRWAGR